MLIMCIKQIYIMVTSKPLYICQNVLERYGYGIFPCRTKSPNVLVDRILAKYHREGRTFYLQDTLYHILFLGHCLSITKTSSKMTNGQRGERQREDRKQELRSRSLPPLARHKKTFPMTGTVTLLHMEKSAPMEGTQHRKELGIPHYQDKTT